jgi:hypothetical protein
LFLVVSLIGLGCRGDDPFGPQEQIIFQNRSGIDGMNCYIDDALQGTVNNGQDLQVEGDYEGDRVLRANAGSVVWGPRSQHIDKGMRFFWELGR